MAINIRKLSRETGHHGPGTFELRIKWDLTFPHENGLILQNVRRTEEKSMRDLQTKVYKSCYWEAWRVVNGQVMMEGIPGIQSACPIPPLAADDSFAQLKPADPQMIKFATTFNCSVYWLDATDPRYATIYGALVNERLPEAGFLMANKRLPEEVDDPPILIRNEHFKMKRPEFLRDSNF